MKSYKPKFLSDYSEKIQRKILYREPAFLINVKFNNVAEKSHTKSPKKSRVVAGNSNAKKSPKKSPKRSLITAGSIDAIIKSNQMIFKIIADTIQPNSAISIINRFIATNNTTIDKLKLFMNTIKDLQYTNHNNLDKHLRVLLTDYKTVINVDGNNETNKIISEILPNASVKNIDMNKFVENIPTADLYIFDKCISKYASNITDNLANLNGSIFVCDYDIESADQQYYINFAHKLTSSDPYFYNKKINIINLFGRIPTGESRALLKNLYNEYAIMFS